MTQHSYTPEDGYTFTAGELIRLLQTVPEDTEVFIVRERWPRPYTWITKLETGHTVGLYIDPDPEDSFDKKKKPEEED